MKRNDQVFFRGVHTNKFMWREIDDVHEYFGNPDNQWVDMGCEVTRFSTMLGDVEVNMQLIRRRYLKECGNVEAWIVLVRPGF